MRQHKYPHRHLHCRNSTKAKDAAADKKKRQWERMQLAPDHSSSPRRGSFLSDRSAAYAPTIATAMVASACARVGDFMFRRSVLSFLSGLSLSLFSSLAPPHLSLSLSLFLSVALCAMEGGGKRRHQNQVEIPGVPL